MLFEFLKFVIYSGLIVLISKYILVTTLRKLAESMQLKSKTVGNIAGIATSIPELLTVTISSASGLFNATIFNVLSSNIINFIQYIFAIISNKNTSSIKNKAIMIDILLVIATILIAVSYTHLTNHNGDLIIAGVNSISRIAPVTCKIIIYIV